ncbi:MAG: diversity-generating retroelement protein Avd [Firmicutes bacterium]|nr:diversity-generating retroelement protein Avd [Bacillota bacterium]
MKDVEELHIYKQYITLIFYTENIVEKYPKHEKNSLVSIIKNITYDGMKNVLEAYKYFDKSDKLTSLNSLDINLKMLKILIRISYKKKYISIKNYKAWSKKIYNIGNMLGGWITSCVKA